MVRVPIVALVLALSAQHVAAQSVGRRAGPDDDRSSDAPSRFAPEPRQGPQPFQPTPSPSPTPRVTTPSPPPVTSAPTPSPSPSPSPSPYPSGPSSRFAPDYGRLIEQERRRASEPSQSYPSDTGYGYGSGYGYGYYPPSQVPGYVPPHLPTPVPRNVVVPDPAPQSYPNPIRFPQAYGPSGYPTGTYQQPAPPPNLAPGPNGRPGVTGQPLQIPPKSYGVAMPKPRVSPWGPDAPADGGRPASTPQAPGGPSRIPASQDLQRFRGAYGSQRNLDDRQVAHRRPDGVEVISDFDPKGHLRRRYRRHPDGHERTLIDSGWVPQGSYPYGDAPAGYVGALPPAFPERSSEYVINVGPGVPPGQDAVSGILDGAPIEALPRAFALEEIVANLSLRQRMPRAEVEAQVFAAGSSTPTQEGLAALAPIGASMRAILLRSPDEIFLVEAHTDTDGDEAANLELSVHRAEAVAAALTRKFGIPAENLVTQGYGESHPLEGRPGGDLRNRRITVRRITPLLRPPTGA